MVRELKKDNIVKMKVEGKEKRNTCTQLNHSMALFQQKKNHGIGFKRCSYEN
jgi:hypothetical protein